MSEEYYNFYSKSDVLKRLDHQRERLDKNLPFFIESYTPFKIIPYIYSTELEELISSTFKLLMKSLSENCSPYEEKEPHYDYCFDFTPLIGNETIFMKNVLFFDNLLDKRIIEKWLTLKGRILKKKFVEILINISQEVEDYISIQFLFLNTLLITFSKIKADFHKVDIGKVAKDRKDSYFSIFFFFYFKLIIDDFYEEIKLEHNKNGNLYDLYSPIIFADIKTAFFRTPFNYWGLSKNLFLLLDRIALFDNYEKNKDIIESIKENKEIIDECLKNGLWQILRSLIFDFLSKNYKNQSEFMRRLVVMLYNQSHFFNFIKDSNYRDDVFRTIKEPIIKEDKLLNANTTLLKENIEEILEVNSKKVNSQKLFLNSLKGYFNYKSHLLSANFFSDFFKVIRDRRQEKTFDLKEEYENGKLYYFSFEKNKLLMNKKEEKIAAIYIDIRDFSKKTSELKEDVISELLKDKFYAPILHYASERKKTGEIILHNIVGDSLIFTGSIDELLKLAIVIKKDSENYKSGLEHIIFDSEKKELMTVDLGIFVAYGVKPRMFNIQSEFGNHYIAIGDVINLSSRGAKRDPNAKKRLDYLIETESKIRGFQVKLPFNVYIMEGFSVVMPPTIEHKLLTIKDEKPQKEIMSNFFEQLSLDLKLQRDFQNQMFKEKYIFNIGIGLTEESFLAFLRSQWVLSNIKKHIINVEQFSENIKKNYLFLNKQIEFASVKNRKSNELFIFRKEGSIMFKGIEKETVIWELIPQELSIYKEIVQLCSL